MKLKQKFFFIFLLGLLTLLVFLVGLIRIIYFRPFVSISEPKKHEVRIVNYRFYPREVRVRYGDTVVWKNLSDTRHTVTFRTLSKTLSPGEVWEWVISPDFFLKGTNMYWCDFHANSKGMVGARVIVD